MSIPCPKVECVSINGREYYHLDVSAYATPLTSALQSATISVALPGRCNSLTPVQPGLPMHLSATHTQHAPMVMNEFCDSSHFLLPPSPPPFESPVDVRP